MVKMFRKGSHTSTKEYVSDFTAGWQVIMAKLSDPVPVPIVYGLVGPRWPGGTSRMPLMATNVRPWSQRRTPRQR